MKFSDFFQEDQEDHCRTFWKAMDYGSGQSIPTNMLMPDMRSRNSKRLVIFCVTLEWNVRNLPIDHPSFFYRCQGHGGDNGYDDDFEELWCLGAGWLISWSPGYPPGISMHILHLVAGTWSYQLLQLLLELFLVIRSQHDSPKACRAGVEEVDVSCSDNRKGQTVYASRHHHHHPHPSHLFFFFFFFVFSSLEHVHLTDEVRSPCVYCVWLAS